MRSRLALTVGRRFLEDRAEPGVMVGREQAPGRREVVREEGFPTRHINAGAEPEPFQAHALDRAGIAHQPIDLGPIRGVEAVEVEAEDAAAIRLEGRLAARGVEFQELFRSEPAEQEIDQDVAPGSRRAPRAGRTSPDPQAGGGTVHCRRRGLSRTVYASRPGRRPGWPAQPSIKRAGGSIHAEQRLLSTQCATSWRSTVHRPSASAGASPWAVPMQRPRMAWPHMPQQRPAPSGSSRWCRPSRVSRARTCRSIAATCARASASGKGGEIITTLSPYVRCG